MEEKWIPIKKHKMDDGEIIFDCEMPEDREEIFVTIKDCYGIYVLRDYCGVTSDNRYYLEDGWDDGLDWYEDVIAWMPAGDPEPYKEE
jgi:hypothetical protein